MSERGDEMLPSGWAKAKIAELVSPDGRFLDGDWVESKDQDPNGDIRLIQLADIGDGAYLNRSSRFLTSKKAIELRCKFLKPGDVLVARMPDPLGRACIFPGDHKKSVTVVDVCIVRSSSIGPNNRWLVWAINSPEFRSSIAALESGTTRKRISRSNLATLDLPVPPLPEQHRIVAEIEKQLARLEAAVAALRRVQANLKRYRASVLKAACEGRLVPTEAELARREGRDYEPADQLLARILKERRVKWEADQFAKMQTAGKPPKDDKWKAKYQESSTPDTSDLPELPEGWTWVLTNQIAAIQGGIQKQPKRTPKNNAFPFLRVANVLRGRLDLSEIHQIELFGGELQKLHLEVGDLLIVEGNGSASEIGRMAFWSGAIKDCVHQNHIIRARLLGGVLAPYVSAYWNSTEGASRVLAEASSTSGLYTLSVTKVGHLPIPLPPLSEQERIVAEIDRRLSVIDELASIVHANMKRAERLRQAILKRAFEGKLVPQDPNDEPAGALLDRICAERAKAQQTRASRGDRSRRTTSRGQRTKAEL